MQKHLIFLFECAKIFARNTFLKESIMSKVCELCGKGKMDGKTVSHANNKAPRKYSPNLQETVVDGKKVKACTKCIKTAKKK